MMYLRHLIFLFIFPFCIKTVFSEELQVALMNKRDHLELIINKNKISETGSWMIFLSNELETGSKQNYAGLSNVDFKIEGEMLSRYILDEDPEWRGLRKCKKVVLGSWQLLQIPKSVFLKPEGEVHWRFVAFPHGKLQPEYHPRKGIASINLKHSIDVSAYNGEGLNFASFYQGQSKKVSFRSGKEFVYPKIKTAPYPIINYTKAGFVNPIENALWWPTMKGVTLNSLAKESRMGLKVKSSAKAIVFDRLQTEDLKLKRMVLRARLEACKRVGKKAFFHVVDQSDIMDGMDGLIVEWPEHDAKYIAALKELRSAFFGPIWGYYGPQFWNEVKKNRNLSLRAWLKLKIIPLLSPQYIVEELSHQQTVFYIWFKLHIEYAYFERLEMKKISPVPAHLFVPEYRQMKKYSMDLYLKKVSNLLKDEFYKIYPY